MLPQAIAGGTLFAAPTCASRAADELVQVAAIANLASRRTNHRIFRATPTRLAKEPADKATNEGNGEYWGFGNIRFSVNWHGDSDGCQLRDHHRRGQYGYDRNCAVPHFSIF